MKKLLGIALTAIVAYYWWRNAPGHGPPLKIDNPVYGEVRVTNNIQDREIEMALFFRASDDGDCHGRASISWNGVLENCPTCKMETTKCQAQLPSRYARLFDDVPIPSTYLAANAGNSGERDGRIVVYGLTDAEGKVVCEVMRGVIVKKYHGEVHCVAPSGA